jgi:hypothetical protein
MTELGIYRPVRMKKKTFRKLAGLLLPVQCPNCRQITRQKPVAAEEQSLLHRIKAKLLVETPAKTKRQCIPCGHTFVVTSVLAREARDRR